MKIQIQIIGWGEAPDEPLVSTFFGSRGRPPRHFIFNRLAKAMQRAVPAFIALLLPMVPAVAQAQFSYTTNDDTITITGYTGSGGDVTIPDTISGLPVTSIGYGAFSSINVTNVTIPGGVTNIWNNAFEYCDSLTAIIVDAGNPAYSSLDGILFNKSQSTLIRCPRTKAGNYAIPGNVISIGYGAFFYCDSLTNVTIGNGVTTIGTNSFCSCASLTSVSIPDNVTSIEDGAFAWCLALTSVTISYGVTAIGDSTFGSCGLTNITVDAANPAYSSLDGVLFDKSQVTLIQFPEANAGNYTIPGSVTNIGQGAFSGCGLTSVTIPDRVTSIGDNEFAGCFSLTNVTLGNSVTSIGFQAFVSCPSLTSVTIPTSVTNIGQGAFYFCGLTSVTIPERVTSIGYDAFLNDSRLTNITVAPLNPAYSSLDGVLFDKNQVTLIQFPGGKAGSYDIPDSVTNIGDLAFYDCITLTGVTIPNSVTTLGEGVFANCGLTHITIPNSVRNIIGGDIRGLGAFGAFLSCTNLTSVYFEGDAPDVDLYYAFNDDPATFYYFPGTTGWDSINQGVTIVLWKPLIQAGDANFGVRTNQFGFNIAWASGQTVVVEACTNLANPVWSPIATNILTGDSSYFSDPQWTNYPARLYRLRPH